MYITCRKNGQDTSYFIPSIINLVHREIIELELETVSRPGRAPLGDRKQNKTQSQNRPRDELKELQGFHNFHKTALA